MLTGNIKCISTNKNKTKVHNRIETTKEEQHTGFASTTINAYFCVHSLLNCLFSVNTVSQSVNFSFF